MTVIRTEIRRVELAQFILRERIYPAGLRLPRHAHDYSNITIIIGGDSRSRRTTASDCGRAFSVVELPPGNGSVLRFTFDGNTRSRRSRGTTRSSRE